MQQLCREQWASLLRGGSTIHNLCLEPPSWDDDFDVREPEPARAAKLVAFGWPSGQLPSKKELKAHVLARVEWEYAEYLLQEVFCCRCRPDDDDAVMDDDEYILDGEFVDPHDY